MSEDEAARPRQRLEAQLREAEAHFRALVEQVPAVTYTVALDERFTLLYVSPQVEALTGYTAAEVLEDQDLRNRQVHPEDAARLLETRSAALAAGERLAEEYRIIRKDGSTAWIHNESLVVHDDQGRPLSRQGVLFDITERRQAEENQRLLAEAGVALASSLDYDTTLARVVQLAVPLLGDWCFVDVVEDDEGNARRLQVAYAEPGHAELATEVQRFGPRAGWDTPQARVLRSGAPLFLPNFGEQVDTAAHDSEHARTIRAVGVRSMIIVPLSARGRTLGALSFLMAKSGRVHSEADLVLAEELGRRAALAVDNARLHRESERARGDLQQRWMSLPEAALVLLPDDSVYLNELAAASLKLSALVPYTLEKVPVYRASGLHWTFFSDANPLVRARAAGAQARALEFQVRTTDGVTPIVANVGPLDLGEGGRAAIMLFQPMSQLRLLEDTKTDFMRVLAHELRHPLATANLALELLEGALTGEQQRYLDTAQREIATLDRLVAELTGIIGAGQDLLSLDTEDVDMCELVQESRAIFEAVAPEHRVELTACEDPCPVHVDRRRIGAVLTNLIWNATRQAPAGTRITVKVDMEDEDNVRVAIADEGPELTREVSDRLFAAEFRGDSHGSLGLGVYLARRILAYHDGALWYEAGPPAEFCLRVPCRPGPR